MSKLRHVFKKIMIRLDTAGVHSIELRYLTIAMHWFVAENLFFRGTRCELWIELVAALLPSHLIYIVALVSFFSNDRHFSFQRKMDPQSPCIVFLEASTSFFVALYFDTYIVIRSQSTLISSKGSSEEDFAWCLLPCRAENFPSSLWICLCSWRLWRLTLQVLKFLPSFLCNKPKRWWMLLLTLVVGCRQTSFR